MGHVADVLGCSIALADIRLTQGRVNDALATYDGPCSWPPVIGNGAAGTVLPGTADMYMGIVRSPSSATTSTPRPQLLMSSQELGEALGSRRTPTGGASPWPG